MMMDGRVRAALKLLSDDSHTGLLSLDQTIDTTGKAVINILEDKYPYSDPVHPEAKMQGMTVSMLLFFDNITADSIWITTLHTQGAARPFGLDALHWRQLCTTFGQKSNDLCAALAAVAQPHSSIHLCY